MSSTSYREFKIVPLTGDVDGVNRTFTTTPNEFFPTTERVFYDGVMAEEGDDRRGWTVVNNFTIETTVAPRTGTFMQLGYREQDATDTLGNLVDVKGSPFTPDEGIPGMGACISGGAWACDPDNLLEYPILEGDCLSADEVGDCVYIRDPKVADRYQVAACDISDVDKVPAAGIILEKQSSTTCTFMVFGKVTNMVSGLDPDNGRILYVGADAKLTQTRPAAPLYAQPFALLLDDNEISINPDMPVVEPSSGAGAGGWLRVYDCEVAGGEVTDKAWQDPGQTVLQTCTVSGADVTLKVKCSYPKVRVGAAVTDLGEAASGGYYEGDVDVTIAGSGSVVVVGTSPDDTDAAQDTIGLTLALPPVILSLSFTGGYPGGQTQLKAGDAFQLTGTTDIDADAVDVQDFGAMASSLEVFAAGTSFTVTGTVADRGTTTQSLAARVRARDAVSGAFGPARDTNELGGSTDGVDLVKLNNTYPTATWGSPSYPGAQAALKGSEPATVPITLADLGVVDFTSPTSELSITNPTTIETPKTVTRIAGAYNVLTDNLRCVATRTENAAQTTANTLVKIAAVAAGVSVVEPAARLRSGGNDSTSAQDHQIQIQADQDLLEAPTMDADTGGGTLQGGAWTGGPSTWSRDLQVHDDDTKGTYTWQNLSATNLAGIVTTSITGDVDYILGGFVQRALTFAAFSQSTTMNVAVVDYSKVSAGIFTATNQPAVRHSPQGDHADAVDEYTIDSPLGTNPQTLWWNDVSAANSNSSGTAQITDVEEAV